MRRASVWLVLCLALGFMGGCALFQPGVDKDGNHVPPPIVGVGGAVATAFGYGWVTTLIGAATTAYAAWKGKGWKAAAVSTMDAIEAWKSTDEGKKHWEALKAKLGQAHADAEVKKIVDAALGNT